MPRRALVIDDSRAMRIVPAKMLKGFDFEVLEASDGAEALERLAEQPDLDVILLDWRMEGMDGLAFLQELRSQAAFATLPVIMVTVENDREKVLAAQQAGVTEYLLKPFEKGALLAKLQRLGLLPSQRSAP